MESLHEVVKHNASVVQFMYTFNCISLHYFVVLFESSSITLSLFYIIIYIVREQLQIKCLESRPADIRSHFHSINLLHVFTCQGPCVCMHVCVCVGA